MKLLILEPSPDGWLLPAELAASLLARSHAQQIAGRLVIRVTKNRIGPTDLEHPDPTEPVVEWFPCTSRRPWPLVTSLLAKFQAAYPAVNVPQECKVIQAWLAANPNKAKTYAGMPRFLNNWFSRCQNRGGSSPPALLPFKRQTLTREVLAERERQATRQRREEEERIRLSWEQAPPLVAELAKSKSYG